MSVPSRARCPNCNAPNGRDLAFCGRCGFALREPSTSRQPRVTFHGLLKGLLALWTIAYPVISCGPLFATGTHTAGETAVGGLASLLVGATLFGPWIVGIIVLGILTMLTR